jgi:hypothetical protein
MAKRLSISPTRRAILVLALSTLVYWPARDIAAQARKKRGRETADKPEAGRVAQPKPLPIQVQEMREAILAAVRSGQIEELRYAIELNEMRPELGAAKGTDPIAHLRQISGDGNGREFLAILGKLLDMPPATLPVGRDVENNLLYVWPYLAEIAPANLTPSQQVDVLRLVGPDEAKAMRTANKWLWWRLAIGADGTWHAFMKAQ